MAAQAALGAQGGRIGSGIGGGGGHRRGVSLSELEQGVPLKTLKMPSHLL